MLHQKVFDQFGLMETRLQELRVALVDLTKRSQRRTVEVGPPFSIGDAVDLVLQSLSSASLSQLAPAARISQEITSFDTLALILQYSFARLRKDDRAEIATIFDDSLQTVLSDLVWAHWDVSGSTTLLHKCRSSLEALVSLSVQLSGHVVPHLLQLASRAPFLRKRTLHFILALLPETPQERLDVYLPRLWERCVEGLRNEEVAPLLGRLGVCLAERLGEEDDDRVVGGLSAALLETSSRTNTANYLLRPLLKARPRTFMPLFDRLRQAGHDTSSLSAVLVTAEVGTSLRLLPREALPDSLLRSALAHTYLPLRMSAFTVLIAHPVSTTPFPGADLDALLDFIRLNIGEPSPTGRNALMSGLLAFLSRLKASTYSSQRDLAIRPAGASYVKQAHDWLESFLHILIEALAPSRPYRYHINSLRALDVLLRSFNVGGAGKKPLRNSEAPWISEVTPEWGPRLSRALQRSLLSTFDDVQDEAAKHLMLLELDDGARDWLVREGVELVGSRRESEAAAGALFLSLVLRKWVLDRGVRIDLRCGMADLKVDPSCEYQDILVKRSDDTSDDFRSLVDFFLQVVDAAERRVDAASRDLVSASTNEPAHGLLLALQYVLKKAPLKTSV
jgi:hypothetical protein